MRYLVVHLFGLNLLAISAYLLGRLGETASDLAVLGLSVAAMAGTCLLAWASFSGRFPLPAKRKSDEVTL